MDISGLLWTSVDDGLWTSVDISGEWTWTQVDFSGQKTEVDVRQWSEDTYLPQAFRQHRRTALTVMSPCAVGA